MTSAGPLILGEEIYGYASDIVRPPPKQTPMGSGGRVGGFVRIVKEKDMAN
jgi:hypothetical protein